jgi:hypothetical protein
VVSEARLEGSLLAVRDVNGFLNQLQISERSLKLSGMIAALACPRCADEVRLQGESTGRSREAPSEKANPGNLVRYAQARGRGRVFAWAKPDER